MGSMLGFPGFNLILYIRVRVEPFAQPGLADPGWIPRIPKLRPRRFPLAVPFPAPGSQWLPNRKSACYMADPGHSNKRHTYFRGVCPILFPFLHLNSQRSQWIANRKPACCTAVLHYSNKGDTHPSLAPRTGPAFSQLYYCRLQFA